MLFLTINDKNYNKHQIFFLFFLLLKDTDIKENLIGKLIEIIILRKQAKKYLLTDLPFILNILHNKSIDVYSTSQIDYK